MTTRNTDDWQLLQEYAKNRSETAFAELVRLHLDWVYSVALRHVSDPHLAEDVAQSVFVLLARKAAALRPGTLLGGWLFRTTCHVAAHVVRAEQRRKIRETTVSAMNPETLSPDDAGILWQQLAPHLDQAVAALSEADRSAILLRFYEKMPLRKIGERLGVSEDAAKKRVTRAVEKMREYLGRRGVKVGGVMLAAVLAGRTVQAASAALAGSVAKLSIVAASASAATMLPQLARQTLDAWRWAKIKLAVGVTAASLTVAFVAADAGGLFSRPSASPAANNSPGANAAAMAQVPDANALSAPTANNGARGMHKTGAVNGWVLDDQDRPIAGALVWGGSSGRPFAQDITDSSGQFALDKLGNQYQLYVTVTADGFAADQQPINSNNPAKALEFRLAPSSPLKLRVVDESDQGIAGVSAVLSSWWGRAGIRVPQPTDSEGRLQWLSPPRGELQMGLLKPGYRNSRTNKLAADTDEHTIVMHPVATVSGSVTDVETGAPVSTFKFTLGRSQPEFPDDPDPIWGSPSQNVSEGFYKAEFAEEQVPYVRIEADAYETVETKIELTNGLEGVCNVQLTRKSVAHTIRGVVLLPNGSPAAGVEVALCTVQMGVMLKGTAFEPGRFGRWDPTRENEYRRKTDGQGSFSFEPKPGAHTVVAVSPAGLGQAHCFDFSKPLEVRLQPWGRIEGTVRARDGHWGDRKLKWQHPEPLTGWMTLFYDAEGFSTRSDATGKFTLEHVPPGDGRVAIDDGPGTAPIFSPPVGVKPGETAQVQVGGGRPVIGKLVAPPDVEIHNWTNQVTLAQMHVVWGSYPMPANLTADAEERWRLEFADTEAGQAWFRRQFAYDFKVGEDGSFTLPEALPGEYWLMVDVARGNLGSETDSKTRFPGMRPQIASAMMKITVPDAPADNDSPVDLGNIPLSATHVRPGD